MDALRVPKGSRFLHEENFDGRSLGRQQSKGPRFLQEETLMGALWVAKGSTFL